MALNVVKFYTTSLWPSGLLLKLIHDLVDAQKSNKLTFTWTNVCRYW